LDRGDIQVGKVADVTILDPRITYSIRSEDFYGKGTNMPYEGHRVTGRIMATILEGRVVFQEGRGIVKER
jgi:dihydroorotase